MSLNFGIQFPFTWELGAVGVESAGNHPGSCQCKEVVPLLCSLAAPRAAPGHSRAGRAVPARSVGRADPGLLRACASSHMGFPPVLLPPSVLAPPRVVPWGSCVP